MYKGQKSVRNGIEDFLCPFAYMYISQGSNGKYSHRGIMANDVRGLQAGVREGIWAPCTSKCLKKFPESGQSMWQSCNSKGDKANVRFKNGRVAVATYMLCHDDSMDCYVGQIVSQGSQIANMGTKGNATGVHTHIQVSQSDDTSWFKNEYGIYKFNNEYDLDDCYFVDNTNIIHGMGGDWKTTKDVKVETPVIKDLDIPDQILTKGSKVKFDGIFKVDMLKTPTSTNLFGCCELTGNSLEDYRNERVKDYHWIPTNDWTEVDKDGNSIGQDDILQGEQSYVLNKNIYEVKEIDIPTNSAKLNINGRDVWVYSVYLYEVANN